MIINYIITMTRSKAMVVLVGVVVTATVASLAGTFVFSSLRDATNRPVRSGEQREALLPAIADIPADWRSFRAPAPAPAEYEFEFRYPAAWRVYEGGIWTTDPASGRLENKVIGIQAAITEVPDWPKVEYSRNGGRAVAVQLCPYSPSRGYGEVCYELVLIPEGSSRTPELDRIFRQVAASFRFIGY